MINFRTAMKFLLIALVIGYNSLTIANTVQLFNTSSKYYMKIEINGKIVDKIMPNVSELFQLKNGDSLTATLTERDSMGEEYPKALTLKGTDDNNLVVVFKMSENTLEDNSYNNKK